MNHINKIEMAKLNVMNGLHLIKQLENVLEMWRPVDGYDNYMVSSFGNIKNSDTKKLLKLTIDNNGYYKVELYKDGNNKTQRIHRLVALAFLKNPINKPCVDHADNNPLNNHLSNLRWATTQENNMNAAIQKNNSSGTTGVYWNKRENKWRAKIQIDRKSIHLGYYTNKEDAINARIQKANEVFGEFTHSSQKQ
jgi:hypothetical protein